ncbi:MAG: Mur ligase family protein, partial [Thermomicrobiales bacterium]
MNYEAALAYLLAPTDPSRPVVHRPDANLNLPRMRRLLDLVGAPDAAYDAVVIAGTKGKGSTSAMLDALARATGKRVGLYTQPHLHDYRERVRVNGVPISRDALVAAVERLRPAVETIAAAGDLGSPSTYDLGTALALLHFATAGVELAVLEIGLGGRYDSVNTVIPRVSVITSISIDHTAVLGDTIEQIAGEKAGIIKPGVPVVAQPQRPAAWDVIAATAAAQRAPLHRADTLVQVTPAAHQPDPLTGQQAITLTL